MERMKETKKAEEKRHFSFFTYGPYLIGVSTILLFVVALTDAIEV